METECIERDAPNSPGASGMGFKHDVEDYQPSRRGYQSALYQPQI